MFTVIYTFKVHPGKSNEFIESWKKLTELIYEFEGSLGSRLHKVDAESFIACAQWPSKEVWSNSGKKTPAIASEYKAKMKASCSLIETTFEMETVADYIQPKTFSTTNNTPRVTGVGGVFLKSTSPDTLKKWYAKHLGLVTDAYGASFEFRNADRPNEINYLQWSLFKNDTDYFLPSDKPCMINYRVEKLEELLIQLKAANVTILDEVASYDYGKFVHILDPENNKIELWEPVDKIFTDVLNDNVTK